MFFAKRTHKCRNGSRLGNSGFTMVEILVASAVGALVIIGCVSTYSFLLKTYRGHKDFTISHTKLRGSSAVLTLAAQASGRSGLDPGNAANFRIFDIAFYDLNGGVAGIGPNTFPSFAYRTLENDVDGNGFIDDRDGNPSLHRYRLRDNNLDGRPDLMFEETDSVAGLLGAQLVVDGLDAFSIAYAVDWDRDGILETVPGGAGVMWCIDTNNDNELDSHLDWNFDGIINEADDPDRDGFVNFQPIGRTVERERIRQVKMWLLVRSDLMDPSYDDLVNVLANNRAYAVGHRVIWAPGDGFRRRVVTMGITLRNNEGRVQ